MERKIAPVVHIRKLKDRDSDFAYWQNQPYEARIAALEEIRREYHDWLASQTGDYSYVQPGIQKVFRVVKIEKTKKA